MTEIDYLRCKLSDSEKAFDKLHKRHMKLLKEQGELERKNEQLKLELKELVAENKLLEIKANKFERKYIETKLKNDDLKKENKIKTELIKNLERKVKSQKQRLREMQE